MPQKKKASAKTAAVKSAAARHAQKPAPKSIAKAASKVAKAGSVKSASAKPVAAKVMAAKKVAAKFGAKPAKSKIAVKHAAPKVVAKAVKTVDKKVASVKPAAKPAVAKVVKTEAKKPIIVAPVHKPVAAAKAPVAKPAAAKPDMPKAAHLPPAGHAPAHAAVAARNVPAAVAKPAAQRISSPMVAPKDAAARALELHRHQQMAAATAAKKPVSTRHGFKTNEFIVYPAHGVGRIVGIEEQEIAGMALELFVITFEKDKMTLRVPTGKLQSVGMRKLADETIVKRAMETLKGRARIKRTMWSRRAQEYEAKINSGDLISIAEVVRDLYRSETQPEQSYSERQLYEAALDRMAREIAAVDKLDERGAVQKITEVLSKSAKGRRAAEEAEAEAGEGDEEVQAA